MPPHVLRNLKNDITAADEHKDVTLIFADIVGFTEYSSTRLPNEVVSMLSKLFTTFDHLCVENDVYKVCTIGDCYVIMGYRGSEDENERRDPGKELLNMANMGINIIKAIAEVNEKNGIKLDMRVGLHTGQVIAGVTGTNIVRYDIYGPDVMIANEIETNGRAGRINISEVVKNILEQIAPSRFGFEFNMTLEIRLRKEKEDEVKKV
mmetsp:Transcript_11899/g.5978  ORF Transcript_11899/g.5978 Transcript_11899/m.5978 type:complete len:207 (+) Transcript_11899:636-1256(+)